MPRLNDLHNIPCRDCDHLDFYNGYICTKIGLSEKFWGKFLFRERDENLKVCPYFIPRETCVPSDEVKECQFWCFADHHGNPENCPLWKSRPENI